MRGYEQQYEDAFFGLFQDYFDSEKDAGKQHDPANYSLDRMYPLAALAGNPEQALQIIHVAGTKGKGSTCHFLSSMLTAAGCKCGLFTSPHLATVRERFQLDNQLISYELLLRKTRSFLPALQQSRLKPSLFEIFTVLALQIFRDAGMQWAVLETGIGGRLDASNYIRQPKATVITAVSFDHLALLGNSIEAIASEKAGIIKPGVPLILGKQPFTAAEELIRRRATELQAPLYRPDDDLPTTVLPPHTPKFLQDNFALARKTLAVLGLTPQWESFRWPELRARCEKICDSPLVLLDAAHNADSSEKLVDAVLKLYPDTRFTVVLGIVKGKDVQGIVNAFKKLPADFILTSPHTSKGSALPELQLLARQAGLEIRAIIPELQHREQLPQNCPLLFTGSFFTALIGEKLFSQI
jgi:dihydrofolate synthase/folylpolyglutamate synthase